MFKTSHTDERTRRTRTPTYTHKALRTNTQAQAHAHTYNTERRMERKNEIREEEEVVVCRLAEVQWWKGRGSRESLPTRYSYSRFLVSLHHQERSVLSGWLRRMWTDYTRSHVDKVSVRESPKSVDFCRSRIMRDLGTMRPGSRYPEGKAAKTIPG